MIAGILIGIGSVVALAIFGAFMRDLGYKAGKRDYEQWFADQGKTVDEARKQIWRETPLSGKD